MICVDCVSPPANNAHAHRPPKIIGTMQRLSAAGDGHRYAAWSAGAESVFNTLGEVLKD